MLQFKQNTLFLHKNRFYKKREAIIGTKKTTTTKNKKR